MANEQSEGNGSARQPVVTIAALYGAGGAVIGPKVAEQLEVPFLDRQIPEAVAAETGLSEDAVAEVGEGPKSALQKLFSSLGRSMPPQSAAAGSSEDHLDLQEGRLRGKLEEAMATAAISGGVVLGRGGMVVLSAVPWALHVLLGGPREARIEQGMEIQGIDRETAEQRCEEEDHARVGYVRRAYGVDGEDPSLYHLVLDSTALDLDVCAELIVTACRARLRGEDRTAAS